MSFHKHASSGSLDDAEKPFWISYADLMTALMILFLVIMVTALSNISAKTQEVMKQSEKVETVIEDQEVRQAEIESVCDYLAQRTAETLRGIYVDCKLNRVNFGEVMMAVACREKMPCFRWNDMRPVNCEVPGISRRSAPWDSVVRRCRALRASRGFAW